MESGGEQAAFTFTQHLQKHRKQEMKLLQKFRFQFPEVQQHCQEVHAVERCSDKHRTLLVCDSKQDRNNNTRIDNRALVVNGRLVYLQSQKLEGNKVGREMLRQLKQNGISYKYFMLGRKEKYLQLMEQHQKKKEEQVISEYIKKHINMEKTTKIQFADNYENTKLHLFSSK